MIESSDVKVSNMEADEPGTAASGAGAGAAGASEREKEDANANASGSLREAQKFEFDMPPNPYSLQDVVESADAGEPNDLEDSQDVEEMEESADRFPMRQVNIPLMGSHVQFNPCTSLIGVLVLLGMSIWCMVQPSDAKTELTGWRDWAVQYFTWFYMITQVIFMFFVIFVAWRFGNVKLGRAGDEPEFDLVSYFAMLFSAGVAVGLFFYGVSEPLFHQTTNRFSNVDAHSQDQVDMFALALTYYHWGLAAWAPYLVVALSAGISAYRFHLPMTFRSTFFPLLGGYVWGWIGDVIDGFTIVTVVSGVCTSLGLGATQIITGLQRVGAIDPSLQGDDLVGAQVGAIVVVTCVATMSVVSGLNIGIKYLSQFAFALGCGLLFAVLALDKTAYLLNLVVEASGYYLQYAFFEMNFASDAFGQLRPGEGRSIDGQSAHPSWFAWWTAFYLAWWTAWSSFVGLFVARVSKGRTVREVVVYSFVAPLLYCFLWFGVFGGAGLRQARVALELEAVGLKMFNNSAKFQEPGSEFCFVPPTEDIMDGDDLLFRNYYPGISPVCKFQSSPGTAAWFNVLYSYYDFGPFLSVVSLIAIAVYFVTSSDSGSLIVDHLASNGREKHHWVQRVFWAVLEGLVAIALLVAGGSDALAGLQAASIVAGLPFTVLLLYQCQSIYIMCEESQRLDEGRALPPNARRHAFLQPVFGGVFNGFEFIFSGGHISVNRVKLGMTAPTSKVFAAFVLALFVPSAPLAKVLCKLDPEDKIKSWRTAVVVLYTLCHIAWIALFASVGAQPGIWVYGWLALLMNGGLLTKVRLMARRHFEVQGNLIEDVLASTLLYPQVLTQILFQFDSLNVPEANVVEEE